MYLIVHRPSQYTAVTLAKAVNYIQCTKCIHVSMAQLFLTEYEADLK